MESTFITAVTVNLNVNYSIFQNALSVTILSVTLCSNHNFSMHFDLDLICNDGTSYKNVKLLSSLHPANSEIFAFKIAHFAID